MDISALYMIMRIIIN